MGAVITHRSQHSLLNFSAWPPFSKQQEYFLSAYCLSILGWFGYHPICFCKSLGLCHLFTRKMSLNNFLYILEDFVKIRCMTDQKLQKDRMLSNRVPLTEIRRPAAILKHFPLPPPTLRHSLTPEPLDGQLAQS